MAYSPQTPASPEGFLKSKTSLLSKEGATEADITQLFCSTRLRLK
jgi:hypothetical protein